MQVQPLSFKDILTRLPKRTYLGVFVATTFVYLAIDLFPLTSILPNLEPRIAMALWQSLVWAIYSIFLAFFVGHNLGVGLGLIQKPFFSFFSQNFSEFLAAKLRSLIKSTLWGLLFIIPGFVMAIRYSLNEMVIFYNPGFLQDRTQDPLDISKEKIRFFSPVFFVLLALYFILPTVFDASFDNAHFEYEPYPRLLQILLYTLLNLFTYIYLFKTFMNSRSSNNV